VNPYHAFPSEAIQMDVPYSWPTLCQADEGIIYKGEEILCGEKLGGKLWGSWEILNTAGRGKNGIGL